MAESHASTPERGSRSPGDRTTPTNQPWRTEGMPDGAPPGPRWGRLIGWVVVAWFALFALTTVQDIATSQVAGVAYTEFTDQVEAGNVEEVFSRGQTIEGVLVEPAPVPDGEGTYRQFATERPMFAQDDLLAELEAGDAVVSATPVTQQRGVLSNLLISMLPIALLIAFWVWLFRRQAKGMGGMLAGKKKRPVNPEDVRVSFDDVAGIDEVKNAAPPARSWWARCPAPPATGTPDPRGAPPRGPPRRRRRQWAPAASSSELAAAGRTENSGTHATSPISALAPRAMTNSSVESRLRYRPMSRLTASGCASNARQTATSARRTAARAWYSSAAPIVPPGSTIPLRSSACSVKCSTARSSRSTWPGTIRACTGCSPTVGTPRSVTRSSRSFCTLSSIVATSRGSGAAAIATPIAAFAASHST